MALFGKKKEEYTPFKEAATVSADRLIMTKMEDDDQQAAKLADSLMAGEPLVINFEGLDLLSENKMLAFFTGVTYAMGANPKKINKTTYMFARREDYLDGSLQDFLNSIPKSNRR